MPGNRTSGENKTGVVYLSTGRRGEEVTRRLKERLAWGFGDLRETHLATTFVHRLIERRGEAVLCLGDRFWLV